MQRCCHHAPVADADWLRHFVIRVCLLCLQVYLPMCYIYGKRGSLKPTALTDALRQELYTEPYLGINWDKSRNQCAQEDLFYPHPKACLPAPGSLQTPNFVKSLYAAI